MLWLGNISLIGLPVSAVWDGDPVNHICLWHLLASPCIYEPLLRPVLFCSLALVQHQPLLPALRFHPAPSSWLREHVWGGKKNLDSKLEPAVDSPSSPYRCLTFDVILLAKLTLEQSPCLHARIADIWLGIMCEIWSFVFRLSSCPQNKRVSAQNDAVCPKHLDCFGETLYFLKLVVSPASPRLYYLTIASLW